MTNKKRLLLVSITILLVLTSVVLPIMTGCAETPAETIELTFVAGATSLTPASAPGRALLQWIEEVEEDSDGRVKITPLIGASPDPELFDVVARGAGDVTYNPIMFNTGRFPTLEAMVLPDIGTVCRHPSKVAWDFWKKFPEVDEEFYEVKLLGVFAATQSPPGISFATVDKPVYSLEDFQGLKIGKYGMWGTKTMEALGAVVVPVPPPEVYEAIQKKLVDGSCMDPEMLEAYQVYEVVGYWHNLCHEFVPFFFVVNLDTWNSLPQNIQKILEEAAARIPDRIDADFRESVIRAIEDGKTKYGIEVIDYSPEELARWQARQQPVQDEYIAMLNEKGVDGEKVFDELQRLYEKYAEW